jgi:glyoxylase-like metal-dependent hydrolase (beta-lactamase superfamily II)
MANDLYEVYAIRYATIDRNASENFIGGDPHEAAGRLDYFVWLVRNDSRTFLVDTGFGALAAKRRGREFLLPPRAGLSRLGVAAGAVDDVIVTHLHYDHAGGLDEYANARIHLQDRELNYATGRHMREQFFSHSFEVDEICGVVHDVYRGRVEFHDGDAELAPGLSVHLIGGHTMGIQCVRVKTAVGFIVLASDAAHYYANMEQVRPFPIVFHLGDMVAGFRRLRELADAPQLVVPGHDPLVMQRYPSAGSGLDEIAVRLDREPRLPQK